MNIHKNARLTPLRRGEMARAVLDGLSVTQAACRYGVCPRARLVLMESKPCSIFLFFRMLLSKTGVHFCATCSKIVRRWRDRFKAGGQDGMAERSSRPCVSARKDRSGGGAAHHHASPPAPDWPAHRYPNRCIIGHCQPCSEAFPAKIESAKMLYSQVFTQFRTRKPALAKAGMEAVQSQNTCEKKMTRAGCVSM